MARVPQRSGARARAQRRVVSATLTPRAAAVLRTAAADVRTREPGPVSVVGHTDDQGTDAYNLDLSRRRAQAVASALRPVLGAGYPLSVEGRGESEPASPGTTPDARARNRRVALSTSSLLAGSPVGLRICACGLGLEGTLRDEQMMVASIVYPRLETGTSVTLQATFRRSADPAFRLTDVQVV